MLQRERFDRGKHSERGAGGKDPEDLKDGEEEDSDLPPVPDDELDLSWGKATMPDFSDEPATSLPVASVDNKKIYAAAGAVDSTDATVIAGESRAARKAREKADEAVASSEIRRPAWIPLAVMFAILAIALGAWLIFTSLADTLTGEEAARVNGEVIAIEDLDARFESVAAQNPAMFDPEMGGFEEGEARRLILDVMIGDLLLMQEARREGVDISDAEVQERIDGFAATYYSFEEFEESLRQNDFTLDMLKAQVYSSMTLEALLETVVPADSISDEDVRNHYDDNIERYTEPAAKRTSHILLPLEDEEYAQSLLEELQNSDNLEEDFARIAEESSADSITAAQGGDAGWPRTPDQRHPLYVRTLTRLEVGDMSDLVRTELGFFIILVTEEREESVRSFEDIAPSIRDMLLNTLRKQTRVDLLERLREEASIDILDPAILEFEDGQELFDEDQSEDNAVLEEIDLSNDIADEEE